MTIQGIPYYTIGASVPWDAWQIVRYRIASSVSYSTIWAQTPDSIVDQSAEIPTPYYGLSAFDMSYFSDLDAGYRGDFHLAELLVYSGALFGLDLQKVHSYLAIKYAYTLDPNIGNQSYLFNDGSVAWLAQTGYTTDITGIMRDSEYPLYQRKSQSITNTGDLLVETIGGMPDKSSLIRAHTLADMTSWSSADRDPAQVEGRINRVWYFQKRGEL